MYMYYDVKQLLPIDTTVAIMMIVIIMEVVEYNCLIGHHLATIASNQLG